MAQIRYNNWQDYRLSDINNRKDLGAIPKGRWRGYDYDNTSSGTTLILKHTVTGYSETDESAAAHNNLGMVKTAQGVIVVEDASITIPVTNNAGGVDTRIDLVVLQHTYVATLGGVSAGYSVLTGTVGSGVPPAIPFPLTTIVLGKITWPAGCSDIASATYTQEPAPVVGDGEAGGMDYVLKHVEQTIVAKKQIYHQTGLLVDMNISGNDAVATDNSNFFDLQNLDADYHDIYNFVIPFDGDLTHFSVFCEQRISIVPGVGHNVRTMNGLPMHVEVNEVVEIYVIGSWYFCVKGGEVRRDVLNKMFAGIVGNKATATLAGSTVNLSNTRANFQELTIDMSLHPTIDHMSGNSALWDGTNAITKGGQFLVVSVKNSAGSGWFKYNSLGAVSGSNKPIRFCYPVFGDSMEFSDGYSLFIENENDWTMVAHFDASTDLQNLFALIGIANSQIAANTADIVTLFADITTLNNLTAVGGWVNIGSGGPGAGSGFGTNWVAGAIIPQAKIDGNGMVYCRGQVKNTVGSTYAIPFVLPTTMRPTSNMLFPIVAYDGSTYTQTGQVLIDTAGNVTLTGHIVTSATPAIFPFTAFLAANGAYIDISSLSFSTV